MKITNLTEEHIDFVSEDRDLWILRACLRECAYGFKYEEIKVGNEDLPSQNSLSELCEKISIGLSKRPSSYIGF
ncbi:hypothetical protein [Marinomonas sp. TW1]|uniref:hypothetical protein n=1 Tax=Marinomonas sp. TW1 TaxID=1561203 RepID=UPI0007AF6467|nr:hypothetical protein [Marinomonas sp. TW1]KZN12189.1 hypothetical protein OA79_17550 [Marinomonas sp. TW1]